MHHMIATLNWGEMFLPKPSWAEKLLRPAIVYLIMLVLFRFATRREVAQSTLFDLLIMLLISNIVQNAMIGDDNSILGAAGGALTVILLSGFFNRWAFSSSKAQAVLEGSPIVLVRDGEMQMESLKQEVISADDLKAAIRKESIGRMSEVAFAILETDGSISVIRKDDKGEPMDAIPEECKSPGN